MNPEKFVEEAFKKDNRIRYVGIIDNQSHIVSSKTRKELRAL